MGFVVTSSAEPITIPNVTFTDFILDKLKTHPNVLLTDGTTGKQTSFQEIRRDALLTGRVLNEKYGVAPGDVVTIATYNCVQFPAAFFGILAAGAVVNTSVADFSPEDHYVRTEQIKPVAVFCHPESVDNIVTLQRMLPCIKNIFVLGTTDKTGCISWNDMLQESKSLPEYELGSKQQYSGDQTIFLPVTSGTTGMPKLVMHTHRTLIAASLQYSHQKCLALSKDDVLLATSSVTHCYCLISALFSCIVQGCPIVLLKKFSLDVTLKSMEEYKVTVLVTVPFVATALLHDSSVNNYDLSALSCVMTASSPLPPETGPALKKRFKLQRLLQAYGLTESPYAISTPPYVDVSSNSIGKLGPNMQAKVVDPKSGEMVGPYQRGELWIKGPQVMLGYLGNRGATRDAIDAEGWLHTGDVMYRDKDECFYIVDRMKEFIKYKGYTVSPSEVEAVLLRCADVKECTVVGIPHPNLHQVIHAVVVLAPGCETEASVQNIIGFVNSHSTQSVKLEGVTVVDSLPRNPIGKVIRKDLVRMVTQQKG